MQKARQLVIYHIVPPSPSSTPDAAFSAMLEVCSRADPVAEDGLLVSLPAGGTAIDQQLISLTPREHGIALRAGRHRASCRAGFDIAREVCRVKTCSESKHRGSRAAPRRDVRDDVEEDGRRQRSSRSRERIVHAMIESIRAGADVGLRLPA